MQEELLHFIWQHRNFNQTGLTTSGGKQVSIIKTGTYNTHSGPDFQNAQVQIGDTIWVGHVEIHIRSSDWIAHGHSADKAYDNVILHVVYENDVTIDDKPLMPVIQLKGLVPEELIANYNLMKSGMQWVPCESFLPQVDEFVRDIWLSRMLAERLERKSEYIGRLLSELKNDWAEVAYILAGRNFGFKVNSDAFENLCRSLPQKIPAKHKNSVLQVEALFFGQSGMLGNNGPVDDYIISLKKEYQFLSAKYRLKPMMGSQWKFLRMRPGNFPTYRISQFAALISRSEHLFSRILEIKDIASASKMFEVSASDYWKEHYMFGEKSSSAGPRKLGADTLRNILINTVVPLLFAYGHFRNINSHKETALSLMDEIKSENNNITRKWKELGMPNDNAFQSQALIHLRNEYCNHSRCLSCGIGTNILRYSLKVDSENIIQMEVM